MRLCDSLETSPTLLNLLTVPGNESAWETFVDRYTPLILEQCRKAGLQPADAEEVRSRVLTKLVRALAGLRYDPTRTFRGYLRTVVRSVVAGYWAERSRPGATGLGASGDAGPPAVIDLPAPMVELSETLDDDVSSRLQLIGRVVDRVRRTLQPETWQAYWQTAIEGRKAGEVARALNKSVGAVYMAKHRVGALLLAEGRAECDAETLREWI